MSSATASYRIGVLSDTHGSLHSGVFRAFEDVDLIIHAGDVGRADVLVELAQLADVRAVSGNVDAFDGPRRTILELTTPIGRIGVTHGHAGRASAFDYGSLVGFFREFAPEIIIFGHTHEPVLTSRAHVTLFNPGSASRPRSGTSPTVGLISARGGGEAPLFEHIPLK